MGRHRNYAFARGDHGGLPGHKAQSGQGRQVRGNGSPGAWRRGCEEVPGTSQKRRRFRVRRIGGLAQSAPNAGRVARAHCGRGQGAARHLSCFDGALPSEHQAVYDDLKNESENGAPPPPADDTADDMPTPLEDIMPSPMPTSLPSPMPTSLPSPSPAPPMADESADASSDLMGYVGNATGASGSIDASQLQATFPVGDTLLVPTRTEKTISTKLSNTETLVRNLDRFSPELSPEPTLPAIPTAPLSAAIPSSVPRRP